MSRSSQKPACRGFTLLEVLLALALTTVVLLIVATGVSVQLRAFSDGRARVERAQLARVLLHRIADDLRGALPPGESAAGTSSTSSSTGEGAAGDQEEGSEAISDALGDGEAEEEAQVDLGEDAASADTTVAGVYGELDWLRIDVLRAVQAEAASSESFLPSGSTSTAQAMRQIETIVYYVVTPEEAAAGTLSADPQQQRGGGLVRRELIRPMAVWAAEQASLEYRDSSVAPLAPEVSAVTAVEFRYHDGSDWLESWDTSTSGTLPKAIEIRLFLAPLPTPESGQSASTAGTFDELDGSADVQYRLVVPIAMQSTVQLSASDAAQASSTTTSSSESSAEGSSSEGSESGAGADQSESTP